MIGTRMNTSIQVVDGAYVGNWSGYTLRFIYQEQVVTATTKRSTWESVQAIFRVVNNQIDDKSIKVLFSYEKAIAEESKLEEKTARGYSRNLDLDEYDEESLEEELRQRAVARSGRHCDYCGRKPSEPACKFPERHKLLLEHENTRPEDILDAESVVRSARPVVLPESVVAATSSNTRSDQPEPVSEDVQGTTSSLRDYEFRALLDIIMVSDPWPQSVPRGPLEDLVTRESISRRFHSWYDAYHLFQPTSRKNSSEGGGDA